MTQSTPQPREQEPETLTKPESQLDPRATAYFQRSYAAADGLWFVKVEERFGFDAALDIDAQVWQVLPKIQARVIKELLGQRKGLAALCECLCTRMTWEGYGHEASLSEDGSRLEITVDTCPWHALMLKSGRDYLSGQVGERICGHEYAVWAREFGPGISFSLEALLCQDAPACRLVFRSSTDTGAS